MKNCALLLFYILLFSWYPSSYFAQSTSLFGNNFIGKPSKGSHFQAEQGIGQSTTKLSIEFHIFNIAN